MPAPSSAAINLQRLVVVRAIVLTGGLSALWAVQAYWQLALPSAVLWGILGAMLVVNFVTWARLHIEAPVQDVELFVHLVLDVVVLTGVLYYTGGSTNPFAPLYLLTLTLTAAALPGAYTWVMLALTAACYSLLLFYYVPLPMEHEGHGENFRLHVTGMWLGFLVSASVIAFFAVKMAQTLRSRDQLRAEMRERELKHERVVALGTLAAGAAHELSTPLSTMAILVHDLVPGKREDGEKLETLRSQIERCKQILSTLSAAAGAARAESGGPLALDAYLDELVARWRSMRPAVRIRVQADGPRPAPQVLAEQTLSQAILSVLNNAADASPEQVVLDARWTDAELVLEVCDRGPGLPAGLHAHAGREPFTTKAADEGMGLGLFLAHSTIERLGGRVVLYDRAGGGACCRLALPLAPLRVAA